MSRSITYFSRSRADSPRQLAEFHRSHRGTPTLGCPFCTFGELRVNAPRSRS
jgi:hypothetical protein